MVFKAWSRILIHTAKTVRTLGDPGLADKYVLRSRRLDQVVRDFDLAQQGAAIPNSRPPKRR